MSTRGKVLVIEDNQDWQDILKGYLDEAGFFVEVVATLESGLEKIKNEIYHFATIDLQLDENTLIPSKFEGWKILEKIFKHRTDDRMPTMVITGFDKDYAALRKNKKFHGVFFMAKKNFDGEKFTQTVITAVEKLDVKFFEDRRGNKES